MDRIAELIRSALLRPGHSCEPCSGHTHFTLRVLTAPTLTSDPCFPPNASCLSFFSGAGFLITSVSGGVLFMLCTPIDWSHPLVHDVMLMCDQWRGCQRSDRRSPLLLDMFCVMAKELPTPRLITVHSRPDHSETKSGGGVAECGEEQAHAP